MEKKKVAYHVPTKEAWTEKMEELFKKYNWATSDCEIEEERWDEFGKDTCIGLLVDDTKNQIWYNNKHYCQHKGYHIIPWEEERAYKTAMEAAQQLEEATSEALHKEIELFHKKLTPSIEMLPTPSGRNPFYEMYQETKRLFPGKERRADWKDVKQDYLDMLTYNVFASTSYTNKPQIKGNKFIRMIQELTSSIARRLNKSLHNQFKAGFRDSSGHLTQDGKEEVREIMEEMAQEKLDLRADAIIAEAKNKK